MKRFLALFLSLVLSLASTGVANAADEVSYTYTIIDDKAIIIDVDKNISGDFVIPSSLDGYAIGGFADSVFANCTKLTSITIPEGVTEIVYAMFEGCYNLENINLPDSITTISEGAFYNCGSLSSLELSKNVSEIGFEAIYRCKSLESITVDQENANFSSDENGVLFNKDKTHLCIFPDNNPLSEYVVPDTVTNIFSDAFFYCKNLKKLTIGKNVVSIGWSNFYSQNVTIYGYMDSYAEEYALENDIQFVAMDCGDINSDTAINNKDLGLLMQYLNNWDVTIDVNAADVNYDESVNNKDYGLLMQYLNNWDVVLGKQPEKIPDDGNDNDNNDDNNDDNNNDDDSGVVNPEDYRGTEVVFATTILSATDESGPVIDKFEKDYGITVKEILVANSVNETAGLMAAGVNVDIMRVNGDFPTAMAVLQPITAAKLDMTDPIWDQSVFEYTTLDGEPYLCNTISNIWSERACVIYSKNLLARANCYTPEQYDKEGKWTWDAFAAIGKAVDGLDGMGTGIRGCHDTNNFLLGSIGCGLYKYEDGKFVNGLNDPLHREAMAKIAAWNKEGFYSGWIPFTDGKLGITTGLAGWSLKKNGSNADYNWNDIGFYHLPAYKEGMKVGGTGPMKAWGICRGADNPVGAGIFLRQYLDANNYNTKDAFISDEAATFFFRTIDEFGMDNFTPVFTHADSTENLTGFYEWDWEACAYGDPSQVSVTFDNLSNGVDKACDVLNRFVAKNTGIRE